MSLPRSCSHNRPTNPRTGPNQSLSESATQEAKDLAALRITRRTIRKAGADGPQTPGGRSATLKWTVRKQQQNL
jgi:hypothetical protein